MSADQLIQASIQYHDPHGIWSAKRWEIALAEKRPNGVVRNTSLTIDLQNEYYASEQIRGSNKINVEIQKNKIQIALNGEPVADPDTVAKYRLKEDRQFLLKNYYTYLYGLPMKLLDPGTIVHTEVQDTSFNGRPAYGIKINYAAGVGDDTWYFYFHPNNYALTGYRFYHNEVDNDGEYVLLEGEMEKDGLRLPRQRKWYTHAEDKFLGEDIIVGLK